MSQDLKVNLFGLQQDNVVTVMVRIMMMLWESLGDSHAVTIQWVHMVKDPPVTILLVHTVTSKYTFTINNDRYLITWPYGPCVSILHYLQLSGLAQNN